VTVGTREVGLVAGGSRRRRLLGAAIGLRPALRIATLGGVTGFVLLLPTSLPRYRLPA